MTTANNLIKYKEEIASVSAYAKRTGFDFNTGSFDDLMVKWINHTKDLYDRIEENKDEVKRIVKTLIK